MFFNARMPLLKTKFFLFSFLFLNACQTVAPLSPDQRRALQVRVFSNSSYNTVFRAFKTVMQDEGYIIKNQDFEGGLIVAEGQKPVKTTGLEILSAISKGLSDDPYYRNQPHRTGHVFSWSVNLEKIRDKHIETRIILQEKTLYSQGGQTGREVLEPEIYQNIYAKALREIHRRRALKK